MEAQITAGMKTPVLSSRPGPEGSAGDKGRKRESEALSRTQSTERDEQVSRMPLLRFQGAALTYVVIPVCHCHCVSCILSDLILSHLHHVMV